MVAGGRPWIAALLFLGGGAAAPASAFELPDLDSLLGTRNPLAVFPDSLPARGALRVDLEGRDIYRYRGGPTRHEYGMWSAVTLALARAGPGWIGARFGSDHLTVIQNEVHGEEDALDGGRDVSRWAAALAWRDEVGEARFLAGRSGGAGGPEIAGELRRDRIGPLLDVRARAWRQRSTLDLRQTFHGTSFFFPFEYHDDVGELELAVRPLRTLRVGLRGKRQQVVGEKPDPDRWNLIFVDRWRGELRVERLAAPRIDAVASLDRSDVGMAMALDGTRYAQVDDLVLTLRSVELGWRYRSVRLAAGRDDWRMKSGPESWFDVWPFTVWDIFLAQRYRLESADHDWNVDYVRLTWTRPAGPLLLGFDGRFEWWGDDGALFWKKRVPVLPPFFFEFDHKSTALDWRFTHGAQADVWVGWRPAGSGWFVRLDAQAAGPWGNDGRGGEGPDTPDPPGGDSGGDELHRGGLRFRLSTGADW